MAVANQQWVVQIQASVQAMAPRPGASSIYRVPEWIKRLSRNDAYGPRVVSLGPFHHGNPNLQHMEEHKTQAMQRLVHRSGKPFQRFFDAINGVAEQLEAAYDGLQHEWVGRRDEFVRMMVTDGCFFLDTAWAVNHAMGGTGGGYTAGDPSDPRALLIWETIRMDVVAMENQLPLLALQKLETARRGGAAVSAGDVNQLVRKFLTVPLPKNINEPAPHPLGLLRKCFVSTTAADRSSPLEQKEWENTMPCALVLTEAGIDLKKSRTRKFTDVEFKDAALKGVTKSVLHVPLLRVRYDTEMFLLNMMAFERLHPGAGDEVTSYVSFMRNLINNTADVALLRSKGVLVHTFGSDKAVARLFNNIYSGGMSPYSKLHHVQRKVSAHCERRWNKWRAGFVQSYLSNPWVFISLVAAIILVLATLLQTVYTIIPFYHNRR